MKKITSFFVSLLMLIFTCVLLTSCGDKKEDKLPNDDYDKVEFAFNGVEKSIKSSKTSNSDGTKKRDLYYNSIDQVERITGMDFFPALPDEIENEVEAYSNLDDWK